MPHCTSCGASLNGDIKFCPQCGTRVLETIRHSIDTKKKKKNKGTKTTNKSLKNNIETNLSDISLGSNDKDKIEVPPCATGDEATAIYKRLIAIVRGANKNNDKIVSNFKLDCKAYGAGELKARIFYSRLNKYFGNSAMLKHMLPQLVQLIPDAKKRKKLLKTHAKKEAEEEVKSKTSTLSTNTDRSLMRELSEQRMRSAGSIYTPPSEQIPASAPSRFSIAHRYDDDPTCAICTKDFATFKEPRHKCRKCGCSVCATCSPARMLVAPDQLSSLLTGKDLKDYSAAHPQRVCNLCAPLLQCFQDKWIAQYANCHKENPHEAKRRWHLPYSRSLEKECRNAADIIGNFFRPEYGADSDRYIPVSFLKNAKGLAFLTIIKAGLLVSAKVGTGIVIAKLEGENRWSAPSAIGTAGISGGFEGGGEIIEFMIIMGSEHATRVFHRTQVNVGGGLSLAVGPYGREAMAQAAASKNGIMANVSYSHSRGLFAGISLQGSIISCRKEMNSKFYGQDFTPQEILTGEVPQPRAAQCLYDAIEAAMAGVQAHQAETIAAKQRKLDEERMQFTSQNSIGRSCCAVCLCPTFVPKTFSKKCKLCGHIHSL